MWVRLVEQGRVRKIREGLADVMIDNRYLTEWSICYHTDQCTSCASNNMPLIV